MSHQQLLNELQTLRMEHAALKEGLVKEQFTAQKAVADATQLQADLDAKNTELRELRTSWTEREKRYVVIIQFSGLSRCIHR